MAFSFHLCKSALSVTESLRFNSDILLLNALNNGGEVLLHTLLDRSGEHAFKFLAVFQPLILLVGALDNSVCNQVSLGSLNCGCENSKVDLILTKKIYKCVLLFLTENDDVSVIGSSFDSFSQLTLVFSATTVNLLEQLVLKDSSRILEGSSSFNISLLGFGFLITLGLSFSVNLSLFIVVTLTVLITVASNLDETRLVEVVQEA